MGKKKSGKTEKEEHHDEYGNINAKDYERKFKLGESSKGHKQSRY